MAEGNAIDVRTLGPEELLKLEQSVSAEIQNLTSAVASFKQIQQRYNESRECLEKMDDNSENKELLVPITSSMYVPGKLVDTNKVLLDIGTGYYAERTRSDADDFCKRKLALLEEQIGKVQLVWGG